MNRTTKDAIAASLGALRATTTGSFGWGREVTFLVSTLALLATDGPALTAEPAPAAPSFPLAELERKWRRELCDALGYQEGDEGAPQTLDAICKEVSAAYNKATEAESLWKLADEADRLVRGWPHLTTKLHADLAQVWRDHQ